MGSLSTFGTFTMARLGIYVAQHALNVTGNNISNINTDGYTRQNLDQVSMHFGAADKYQSRFDIRENGGVMATGVDQIRDPYLDIRYRNEMTKVGEMDSKLNGLNQISVIFDEVAKGEDGEGVLEARFNDLLQQMQTLHSQGAGQDDIDSIVRASAEAMAIQFNDYAKQLEALSDTLSTQFKQDLDGVNTTLEKIRGLNESIRKSQVFGGSALTQRDERNLLIDELSEKIGINVTYEAEDLGDGVMVEKLKITTAGDPSHTLIDGIYGSQLKLLNETNFDLGITPLENSAGKLDPARPNELAKAFATTTVDGELAKSDPGYSQTDVWNAVKDQVKTLTFDTPAKAKEYEDQLNEQFGYTKGTTPYFHVAQSEFEEGGTVKAGYENTYVVHLHDYGTTASEIESKYSYVNVEEFQATRIGDTDLTGGLQAAREILTESGEYTTADQLAPAAGTKRYDPDTQTYDYNSLHYDPDAGTKRGIRYYQKALDTLAREFAEAMNEANTIPAAELNTMSAEYQAFYAKNGGALFSNSGNSDDATGITAANISVSHSWAHGETHVLRSKEEGAQDVSRDQSNLAHFVAMLSADHEFTSGASKFTGTFHEMLTDTIAGALAKDTNITTTMLSNYNATADELYVSRDSVMGVDLNDEAMNMMQFQKAYAAACRLMTTYDGLLDKLINGTAV